MILLVLLGADAARISTVDIWHQNRLMFWSLLYHEVHPQGLIFVLLRAPTTRTVPFRPSQGRTYHFVAFNPVEKNVFLCED